jgi:hypothetical protein
MAMISAPEMIGMLLAGPAVRAAPAGVRRECRHVIREGASHRSVEQQAERAGDSPKFAIRKSVFPGLPAGHLCGDLDGHFTAARSWLQ